MLRESWDIRWNVDRIGVSSLSHITAGGYYDDIGSEEPELLDV